MSLSKLFTGLFGVIIIAGCGGGGGGGGGDPPPPTTFTVSGTVSGNTGSVSICLNGNCSSVPSPGGFTLTPALQAGASYNVSVSSSPAGQSCSVTNGSGAMPSSNVTNVSVSCTNIITTVAVVVSKDSSSPEGKLLYNGAPTTFIETLAFSVDSDLSASMTGLSCTLSGALGSDVLEVRLKNASGTVLDTAVPGAGTVGFEFGALEISSGVLFRLDARFGDSTLSSGGQKTMIFSCAGSGVSTNQNENPSGVAESELFVRANTDILFPKDFGGGQRELVSVNLLTGGESVLTATLDRSELTPVWSLDGSKIAVESETLLATSPPTSFRICNADGTGCVYPAQMDFYQPFKGSQGITVGGNAIIYPGAKSVGSGSEMSLIYTDGVPKELTSDGRYDYAPVTAPNGANTDIYWWGCNTNTTESCGIYKMTIDGTGGILSSPSLVYGGAFRFLNNHPDPVEASRIVSVHPDGRIAFVRYEFSLGTGQQYFIHVTNSTRTSDMRVTSGKNPIWMGGLVIGTDAFVTNDTFRAFVADPSTGKKAYLPDSAQCTAAPNAGVDCSVGPAPRP